MKQAGFTRSSTCLSSFLVSAVPILSWTSLLSWWKQCWTGSWAMCCVWIAVHGLVWTNTSLISSAGLASCVLKLKNLIRHRFKSPPAVLANIGAAMWLSSTQGNADVRVLHYRLCARVRCMAQTKMLSVSTRCQRITWQKIHFMWPGAVNIIVCLSWWVAWPC